MLKKRDPDEIAASVANFVANAEKIDRRIRQEVDKGTKPLGYVHVEFTSNGGVSLRWIDQDFKTIESRLDES
jgi:hypothetical protein